MAEEIWREAPGTNGRLEVSNLARVRTTDYLAPSANPKQPFQKRKGKVVRPWLAKIGYMVVSLHTQGHTKKYLLHRLVALAFVEGHFDEATVDHLDGERLNNLPGNLEWVRKGVNTRRMFQSGRGAPTGERHPCAKLSDAEVADIRRLRIAGVAAATLARQFQCSQSLVYLIEQGKRRNPLFERSP